jgi:hypothetical protein
MARHMPLLLNSRGAEPARQAPGNEEGTMRIILIFCLTLFFVSSVHAAAPTKSRRRTTARVRGSL